MNPRIEVFRRRRWPAALTWIALIMAMAGPARAESDSLIELAPPSEQEQGKVRVQAIVTSESIERVDFFLDGQLLHSDLRFPYNLRVPAAVLARGQVLEAVASDRDGVELARDVLPLGAEAVTPGIAIVELRELPGGAWWEIGARVDAAGPAAIERVDFYRGERFVASTRRRPFRARVPAAGDSPFVRAVAHLDSGELVEGVRLLEHGARDDVLSVNLVEIYAMVSDRRGRPVTELTETDFELHDNNGRRGPERFSVGDDVPLSVALVLDRSGSMTASMEEAKQAARLFLRNALDAHDEALLIDFAVRPRLLHARTREIDALLARFDDIRSDGGSAIYDAVMFGLLRLAESPGRKALVLLTDGLDSGSGATVEQCATLARRAGVPVFTISIGERLEHRPTHRTFALRQLAERSGGQAFDIGGQDQLGDAYAAIDRQLRGQYLLAFSTDVALSAAQLDSLRLTVSDRRLRVRAILGGQLQIMD